MMRKSLFAEFVGTATLVATVVGSGIMATNLSSDVGIQLLINTIAIIPRVFIINLQQPLVVRQCKK
jgi:glycerol uptake facilitator-like aquaporin